MNSSNRDNETERPESESEGLFSDPSPVKRENPYLRKNREKAVKADKTPKPKKEVSPRPVNSEGGNDPVEEEARKRTFSDFMFEHVKLITAVATCLVILSLVIITDVTGWVEDIRLKQEQKDKTPLTLAHVRALCDRGQNIVWSDMTGYARYDAESVEDSITWKFKVNNTGLANAELEIWMSGVDTAHAPTYVYLYDLMSGERIDLNKDNLDLFLDKLEALE